MERSNKAWCLLLSAAMVYTANSVAADPVSCSVSPLKKLMAVHSKRFEVREESLFGHSTEGGLLTILSRKATPQRARAELYGETGMLTIDVGYLDGDLMAIARRTYYAEPLPRKPVRTKKVDTVAGFFCSGILILDRQDSGDVGQDKAADLEQLTTWLLDELKSRGIAWSVQLPPKK
jgi:hypothetical protein